MQLNKSKVHTTCGSHNVRSIHALTSTCSITVTGVGGVNRLWTLGVLCTSTLRKRGGGGGVNRLWAPCVLCTSTLCKRGGGANRPGAG